MKLCERSPRTLEKGKGKKEGKEEEREKGKEGETEGGREGGRYLKAANDARHHAQDSVLAAAPRGRCRGNRNVG